MVATFNKSIRRMFKFNITRILAITFIIAVGLCVVTGISTLPSQIRSSIEISSLDQIQTFMVEEIANKIELLAYIFPTFFIGVSALTALTTITRLIEEERPVIACFKTLGYSSHIVVFRYLTFALICSAFGCGIGIFAGNFLLRPVIFETLVSRFSLETPQKWLYLDEGLIWSSIMIAVVFFTVLFSILKCCHEKPANLLRPKPPKDGKKYFLEKIPFIWKKLKFKFKSSLRNTLRYKGRLIMTITSVAGSSIMLFCGLGLFNSLNSDQEVSLEHLKDFTESLSTVAVALILCAVILCALVLFNLTNINIEERRREIATLKVLGYNKIEVSGFIFREITILSTIAIIIGTVCGYYFLGFIFEYIDFGSLDLVEWYTWILTIVISYIAVYLAFALLYRKICKIEMTTSLKTVE